MKLTTEQAQEIKDQQSQQNQLFYTSQIRDWLYHYESNERVGMTDKLYYRLIGFNGLTKCDVFKDSYKKDKIIDVMKDCINNDETKNHIHKIISYPYSTTESEEEQIKIKEEQEKIEKEISKLTSEIPFLSYACKEFIKE